MAIIGQICCTHFGVNSKRVFLRLQQRILWTIKKVQGTRCGSYVVKGGRVRCLSLRRFVTFTFTSCLAFFEINLFLVDITAYKTENFL